MTKIDPTVWAREFSRLELEPRLQIERALTGQRIEDTNGLKVLSAGMWLEPIDWHALKLFSWGGAVVAGASLILAFIVDFSERQEVLLLGIIGAGLASGTTALEANRRQRVSREIHDFLDRVIVHSCKEPTAGSAAQLTTRNSTSGRE